MRVYISNYRNHWLSPYTILEKVFFWREIDYDEPLIERWSDRLQPLCVFLQRVLDLVHPKINYVKIDRWDSWSADHTLALIILPLLQQLKTTKHGAPFVDDEDVPEHLRSTSAPPKQNDWDVDSRHFDRWDWVLDEMIWSFGRLCTDDDEAQFYDHSECADDDFMESVSKLKVDREGLRQHQLRRANGFRLFGKYYQNLWD
jgi:hypothetical protein